MEPELRAGSVIRLRERLRWAQRTLPSCVNNGAMRSSVEKTVTTPRLNRRFAVSSAIALAAFGWEPESCKTCTAWQRLPKLGGQVKHEV